jgi:hypothetical protein
MTQKLKVPVTDLVVEEKKSSGDALGGITGARYFNCHATYAGSELHPTLGMPTELFVKLRQPEQPLDEFLPEAVAGNLFKNIVTDPLPIARTFWGGPHSVICENLKDHLSARNFREKGRVSVSDAKHIFEAYAHVHAAFWRLPHTMGLKTFDTWNQLIGEGGPQYADGGWSEEERERAYALFGPHRRLLDKMRSEIGHANIFQHLSSHATTLCQGDAHPGQVLKIKKHSSYAEEHGRWQIIDFGQAIVANPAIDIGSFMLYVDAKDADERKDCLKAYWDALTGRLIAKGVNPGLTFEQFQLHVRIASTWRMILGFCWYSAEGPLSEDDANAVREESHVSEDYPFDEQSYNALVEQMKQPLAGGGYS